MLKDTITFKIWYQNHVQHSPYQIWILTVHVLFMLVLDEGVAPGLGVLRRHHHADALHRAVLLELSLQLALTRNDKLKWSSLVF